MMSALGIVHYVYIPGYHVQLRGRGLPARWQGGFQEVSQLVQIANPVQPSLIIVHQVDDIAPVAGNGGAIPEFEVRERRREPALGFGGVQRRVGRAREVHLSAHHGSSMATRPHGQLDSEWG